MKCPLDWICCTLWTDCIILLLSQLKVSLLFVQFSCLETSSTSLSDASISSVISLSLKNALLAVSVLFSHRHSIESHRFFLYVALYYIIILLTTSENFWYHFLLTGYRGARSNYHSFFECTCQHLFSPFSLELVILRASFKMQLGKNRIGLYWPEHNKAYYNFKLNL